MLTARNLGGIYVPVVTPFDAHGHLDAQSFEELVVRLVSKGIRGLVLSEAVGESEAVEPSELDAMIAAARGVIGDRDILLIVSTGSDHAADAFQRTMRARSAGADAALVQPPHRGRPSEQALLEHFQAVARAGLPIILDDAPSRSGRMLHAKTIQAVMDLEAVIGLKESSGSITRFLTLARTLTKPMLCGEDKLFFGSLCYGGKGGILASANLDTEQFVRVHALYQSGNIEAALRSFEQLQPLIDFLSSEPHPAPLKWLLAERGHIRSDRMRRPLFQKINK
ncbi:dihydrodipicolinate synthase family protein [Paenibacillus sp. GCM10023250]|uniref:dihydrodipicolinate synthase family protein n=1 Tax=Paenibacillus sp. GCM10023250 TaxID=3252648 RepID=UPI0036060B9C